jgi:hypothetical protein
MGWSINRPTGLTWHRPNLSTKGYTLLTPHGDDTCYLIDMDGRIVQTWQFRHIRPGSGRLLPNGNLLMSGSDVNLPVPPEDEPTKPPLPFEQHVTRLGGYHTTLVEVDWDGNVVWEYINKAQHHDFHRFENGNTMVPEWVELPEDLHKKVRGGYKMPRERLPRLLGDDLVEVDPEGNEIRRIETWKLLDPVKDPIHPTARRWEWTHLNGFDINAAGDIVFSCRNSDIVAVIDNESGEIRSRFRETHGQHNPTWLENGNVLVFDNGSAGSRIVEFNPESDEIVWHYEGRPMQQFFSGHISGVEQLPSGSLLVCEGTSGRLFEVTRDHEVVWEWINPFTNTNKKGSPTVSIYRTHRYLPDHPAIQDKDLSPDRFRKLNSLNGLS